MALDLTRHVPRSPFAELAGIPWLPRLIDKVRAMEAGTLGEYCPFPGPGDQRFLAFFGIDADRLSDAIRSGASDEAIAQAVTAWTSRTTDDIHRFKQEALHRPSDHPKAAAAIRERAVVLVSRRPELATMTIDNFAKLIAAEEGHPIPPG